MQGKVTGVNSNASNEEDTHPKAASRGLCGDNDGILLEVEPDSGEEAYIMPYRVLDGAGTAWFDDVSLKENRGH